MGKASGKPFFFYIVGVPNYKRKFRCTKETENETRSKTQPDMNKFNQNPDSTFDFKKNQDSIKKFRITIKNENPESVIKKP